MGEPADDALARPALWAWSVVGVAAATAVALTVLATRRGAGISPDSVAYVSGARNLAAGRGYVNYALQPITEYPFGLAATLALGAKVGIDPRDGARWLDVLAFGALVPLTFLLACRHVRRLWLAVGAALAVAWSAPLLGVFTEAWSDPVFCLLTVGLLLVLDQVMVTNARVRGWLVGAALLASVAFVFRYAGVVLLALPVLVVVAAARSDGARAVIQRAVSYLTAAAVLPVLVVVHNLRNGSSPFGARASGIETLGGVLHSLGATARSWVLAGSGATAGVGWVVLGAAAVLVILGFAVAWRGQRPGSWPPVTARLLPIVALVVGYVAYLVASELVTNINAIDSRLLSPVYTPAVVLFVVGIDRLLVGIAGRQRWAAACLAAMVGVWLLASLGEAVVHAHRDGDDGQGYAAPSWVNSDFVAAFRRLPPSSDVYSNYADGLYDATGREPILDSPAALAYRSTQAVQELASFRQQVRRARAPVYLVWLNANARTYLVTPELLAVTGLNLSVVSHQPNTTVYRVRG